MWWVTTMVCRFTTTTPQTLHIVLVSGACVQLVKISRVNWVGLRWLKNWENRNAFSCIMFFKNSNSHLCNVSTDSCPILPSKIQLQNDDLVAEWGIFRVESCNCLADQNNLAMVVMIKWVFMSTIMDTLKVHHP